MKTIAISKLIVSEAAKIARRVTEALGYTLVKKSILEGIFRQYGLEKHAQMNVVSAVNIPTFRLGI
jgi:hypothetical protein